MSPADREAALWDTEEHHLQERHQLVKQQLKDQYFLQRHELVRKHEKVRLHCDGAPAGCHLCSLEQSGRGLGDVLPWLHRPEQGDGAASLTDTRCVPPSRFYLSLSFLSTFSFLCIRTLLGTNLNITSARKPFLISPGQVRPLLCMARALSPPV